MTIQITSTTDSPEAVTAALGSSKPAESKEEAKSPSAPEMKESPEQKKESGNSESLETEAKELANTEDEGAESDAEDESDEAKDSEKDKPGKKKGGFQRRIDKLNARMAAREQEIEYWKQEALKAKGVDAPTKDKVDQDQKSAHGKPKAEDYDSHVAYVEALTDWKIAERDKARDEKQQKAKLQSEFETLQQSHFKRVKAFKETVDDFEDVIANLDDVQTSPAVQDVILSSENGPALLYELAKTPEEAKRINALPPLAAARELGKIEAKIAKASEDEKKPEPKKLTKAPEPIKPVGAKGGSGEKPLGELPYQDFKKAREAQLSRG